MKNAGIKISLFLIYFVFAANQDIKDEQATLAAAIAVPICLVFIIAGVSVGGFFYMRRKKKNAGSKDPPTKT